MTRNIQWSVVCIAVAGCGGRADVADVRDRLKEATPESDEQRAPTAPQPGAQISDQPGPTQTTFPESPGVAPTHIPDPIPSETLIVDGSDPPSDSSECFDPALAPLFNPPSDGGIALNPVPVSGCAFSFNGTDDDCTATWDCCGAAYVVRFRRNGPVEGYVDTSWSIAEAAGPSGLGLASPDVGQTCPLFDLGAAAVAADGFGYTPAWETAVREALGQDEPMPDLDPVPIGCDYVPLPNCGARLTCAEHVYEAAYLENGVQCLRDGAPVAPVATDPDSYCWDAMQPSNVPADQCFGPGWSRYFQLAGEEYATEDWPE